MHPQRNTGFSERQGTKKLSQHQRAGSWQAEATQKSHSHCVLVTRLAWLTCANTVTNLASSGLSPSKVSLELERSTVVSQARPLKMEGPEEQKVQTVRGSAHVDRQKRSSSRFGSGCNLREHFSMADITLNVHFAQGIGLIRIRSFCWQSYWMWNRRDFLFNQ